MSSRVFAAAAAAAAVLPATLVFAVPAQAAYPPAPGNDVTQSATTVSQGGEVTFSFGNATGTHFTPGTSVDVTCTEAGGAPGPSTVTNADSSGVATTSFAFSTPGTWTCSASGEGSSGGSITLTSGPLTVMAVGGPGTNGTANTDGGDVQSVQSAQSDSLAKTGGNGNTVVVAVVGGGLLLAGVGAVIVSRRREANRL